MLEDEGAHRVGMAFGADRELSGGGPNLVTGFGAVRIMAVAALDEPDIDAMAIWPGKFGLLRGMTSIAQRRLRLRQHEINVVGFVRAMTTGATDTIRQVFRLGEVLRFQTRLVALGADRCRLRRAQIFEADDLGDVAAAIDVGLAGTVTSLASMLIALQQGRMRCAGEVLLPDLLMTALANVGWSVLVARRVGKGVRGLRRGGSGGLRRARDRGQAGEQKRTDKNP